MTSSAGLVSRSRVYCDLFVTCTGTYDRLFSFVTPKTLQSCDFQLQHLCFPESFPYTRIETVCVHRIPANFFCLKGVRILSWECQDFRIRHDHPKISEDVPNNSESMQGVHRQTQPRTQCLSLKNARVSKKYLHLLVLHGPLVSRIGLS